MLGIYECALATILLRLGDYIQGKRGLAARFGAEYFDDAAGREAVDAKRSVKGKRSGAYRFYIHLPRVSEGHYRPFSEFIL
jgi:hypothetical protein